MATAAEEMHQLTEQYEKMKSLVGTRDLKSEEVTMELEKKDEDIRRLKGELRKRDEEADAIFTEVAAKTEQFIGKLEKIVFSAYFLKNVNLTKFCNTLYHFSSVLEIIV